MSKNYTSNPERENELPLACKSHNLELVKSLIEEGADVNQPAISGKFEGLTPLFIACQYRIIETVKFLMENNVNVNQPITNGAYRGYYPLHIACLQVDKIMVAAFMEGGANVDLVLTEGLYEGETPLYIACKMNSEEIVTLLLKGKADVNQAVQRSTPLFFTFYDYDEENLEELIQKQEEKIKQAALGRSDISNTPLYIACLNGYEKIVEILLSQPDIHKSFNIADSKGKTPEDLAAGNAEIEQLFENYRVERIKGFKLAEDDFDDFGSSPQQTTYERVESIAEEFPQTEE